MTWRPELVALDIDGTLVDRQGNLPLDVKAAVQRVVASATPLVLATGRAWLDARPVFEQLELPPGPVVCSNGAVVLGHPPLKEPRMVTFNPGEVIDTVVEHAPNARIAVEELGVGFRLNRLFPEGDLRGRLTIQSLAELAARPVPRVIVCDPDARQEDFVELAASIGMHGVSYSVGWSAWLDIAPAGVNKATALAGICGELPNGEMWIACWEDYNQSSTPEARLVRDADKLEMVHQALVYERAGHRNLAEFWAEPRWHFTAS